MFLGRRDDFLRIYDRFANSDDPYLLERLNAVACGIALRSCDDSKLSTIAIAVYEKVFANRIPPEHLLPRDYARRVIEYASQRGCEIAFDIEEVRPPYGSAWITESNLSENVETSKDGSISRYVDNDYSNFSKHVCDFDEWSPYRINQEEPWSPNRLKRVFEQSLTERQWGLLLRAEEAFEALSEYRIKVLRGEVANKGEASLKRDFKQAIVRFESSIRKATKKWRFYRSEIQGYVHDGNRSHPPRRSIESKPLRHWLKRRVQDLGWSRTRFGEFDRHVSDDHDEINTDEGFAKKYIWIAVRELQARLADNFELRSSTSIDDFVYDGPWRINWGRDIDPTNTLASTSNFWSCPHYSCWWAPASLVEWHDRVSDREWVKITTDLPEPMKLIELVHPESGKSWLALEGYYRWISPNPIGTDHLETVQRQINYSLHSYLVHAADAEKVASWAAKKRWNQQGLPTNDQTMIGLYSGELFWSEPYKWIEEESPARSGWIDVDEFGARRLPSKVLITAENSHWEQSALDSSLDDGVGYLLPSKLIVDELQLRRLGTQTRWYDHSHSLVADDPSVDHQGPSVLIFEKAALVDYLSTNDLAIFWTVFADRQLIGGRFDHDEYTGHVEGNGFYMMSDGKVTGEMRPKFFAKGTWNSR